MNKVLRRRIMQMGELVLLGGGLLLPSISLGKQTDR